jgi:DNA polymerase-3 subunit gamma/tau
LFFSLTRSDIAQEVEPHALRRESASRPVLQCRPAMSYTVLARKYRPQTFADLVGQEHVTRTLANAIQTGRVAHAFLFTGVRGVGKTTSARILAKALNCERGPTAEPCNVCDICTQVTSGVDLDVLEIDGASNNGVDDVRRLQESLPYRPARDRFKIVIVDEVHMLSGGAFNAFLKTLEEPPAHVKFIFATTESHKVPITIRSRCQRYDFRLIPQAVIAERVRHILASENIVADPQAVAIVAREAAGSMRDAVTLLDQVIAFSGDQLFGSEVAEKLGIADRAQLFQLAESVLAAEPKRALEQIAAIAGRGLDLAHLTRQLLELLRDMVVLQVADDKPELVELPEQERARALEIARAHPLLELERVFAGVAKLVDEVAKSSAPRLLLEMGALRLATRPPLRDLSELIARLSQLETGGSGGSSQPARPSSGQRPAGAIDPQTRGGAEPPSAMRAMAPERQQPPAQRDSRNDPGAKPNPFQRFVPPESSGASTLKPTALSNPAPQLAQAPTMLAHGQAAVAQVQPAVHAVPAPSPIQAASPLPHPVVAALPSAAPAARPPATDRTAVAARPHGVEMGKPPLPSRPDGVAKWPSDARDAAAAPESVEPPARGATAAKPPSGEWSAIIDALRKGEPRWSAMYEHGVPLELTRERVIVIFQEGSFFGRQAQTQGGLDALARAAQQALGGRPEIQVRFALELPGQTVAQRDAAQVDERKESIKQKALSHPRVIEALKVFPELAQKRDVQVD